MNMKTFSALIVGFVLAASFAFAQQARVDQGAPGSQGAWPVRFATPAFPADGGLATGSTGSYPYACATSSPNKVTSVSTTSVNVPTTAATNRMYTVLCNTRDNTTGNVRCRADNVIPGIDAGAAGDVLGVGDCISYTNPSGAPIKCIAAAAMTVSTYECVK